MALTIPTKPKKWYLHQTVIFTFIYKPLHFIFNFVTDKMRYDL